MNSTTITFESDAQARAEGYSDGYLRRAAAHPENQAYMDGHWDGRTDYETEHRD